MISVSNLGKAFGDRVLFEGASFLLDSGERYGLVGANGSGKTTLLGILAGDVEPSEGQVSIPKRLRLGVLRQDQFLYEHEPILDVAMMGHRELWDAMVEKEKILANAEDHFDGDRFNELEELVQLHDGYTAEARAGAILEGLGLPASVHRDPLSTLSGGFKLRVLLAQVLAGAPDVLLLDEPTNHLDILSIRWLEGFLREFQGPVVVISHDHRFLDNVSSSILDVDYRTVTLYPGNYSDFLELKRAERERREKDIASREKEIAHHQKFVDRFRAKASKARQAQSKLRMIEKAADAIEELPQSSRRYPTFRFEPWRESGKEVLRIRGVKKAFGDNEVLHGVDLEVMRGDRLAIIGPNGIGKSTLLKIAVGELAADAGEAAWGYEAHVGYFAQDQSEDFESTTKTAEQWLWDFCPGKDVGYVRGQLGLVLFSGDEPKKRLAALSGGEAARLVFSRLSVERPNVLVLDEPTNHLDLEAIEALVEGLQGFPGTLILVSHDRWFVGELATRIVEIREDGIRDYPGTYAEYVHACGDDHLDADQVVLKAKKDARSGGPGGVQGSGDAGADGGGTAGRRGGEPRNGSASGGQDGRRGGGRPAEARSGRGRGGPSERELRERSESLLARIAAAEARLDAIDALFCQPDYYERTAPDEVRALEQERSELQAEVVELMAAWEEVAERVEAAG